MELKGTGTNEHLLFYKNISGVTYVVFLVIEKPERLLRYCQGFFAHSSASVLQLCISLNILIWM